MSDSDASSPDARMKFQAAFNKACLDLLSNDNNSELFLRDFFKQRFDNMDRLNNETIQDKKVRSISSYVFLCFRLIWYFAWLNIVLIAVQYVLVALQSPVTVVDILQRIHFVAAYTLDLIGYIAAECAKCSKWPFAAVGWVRTHVIPWLGIPGLAEAWDAVSSQMAVFLTFLMSALLRPFVTFLAYFELDIWSIVTFTIVVILHTRYDFFRRSRMEFQGWWNGITDNKNKTN